jgi:cyclophilin family peptidyl-prolyl cis-trans isomerase
MISRHARCALVLGTLAACTSTGGPTTGKQSWSSPPAMTIDTTQPYAADLVTDSGTIHVTLFASESPHTVNNFVFLARQHFYDGTIFHRVIANFMIQGGDPTGTGMGGPGYTFADELPPKHPSSAGLHRVWDGHDRCRRGDGDCVGAGWAVELGGDECAEGAGACAIGGDHGAVSLSAALRGER